MASRCKRFRNYRFWEGCVTVPWKELERFKMKRKLFIKGDDMMANEKIINVDGEQVKVYRIDNDVNGNPRYVIHFLDLGLKEYAANDLTRKAGLKIYRAKWFGGGFVTQSYNIEYDIQNAVNIIKGGKK